MSLHNCEQKKKRYHQYIDSMEMRVRHTSSNSILEPISNICRDSNRRSLPQISLVQTNTMKVALIPNPMIVVIRFIPEPNISIKFQLIL